MPIIHQRRRPSMLSLRERYGGGVLALAVVALAGGAGVAGAQVVPPAPAPQQMEAPGLFGQADADRLFTLEEAIALALDQSFAIFQFRQNYLRSAYALEEAQRNLRARVDYYGNLPSIRQQVRGDLITTAPDVTELLFLRSGSAVATSTVAVQQPLITDGRLTISAGLTGNDTFNELPGGRRTLNRLVLPELSIRFEQPLFQYNQIRGALRSAQLTFERNDLRYSEDELRIINLITRQFLALFRQQRNLEIQAELFRQSAINFEIVQRRYQAGLINEVEYLRLQVRRNNAFDELENQINQHRQAQFAFNRQIGLPLTERVWVEASLEYQPITVDLEQALARAFSGRADERLAHIQREQIELTLESTLRRGRPDLRLTAGYVLTGNSTLAGLGHGDPWGRHLEASFKPAYQVPISNAGLLFTVPLFDWGRNEARVQQVRAELAIQERVIDETRENLMRDVIRNVENLQSAMRRLESLVANRQLAQTTYTFTQNRYERGEVSITELLGAQEDLFNTERSYIAAFIAFEDAKAELREITLWDWEHDRPVAARTRPPVPFGER